MLTPEQWEDVGNQAAQIYSSFELEIMEEIASRIANTSYANRVVYNDALVAQEMGMLYQDIIQLVAKINQQSESEIQRIFDEAGIKSLKFDDKIYKNAGLKSLPIHQSKSMLQLLRAGANKTNGNLQNLCMTTANTVQTDFYNAINKAYLETTTGMKSYQAAIIDAIEELSETGPNVLYPSGRKMSLESSVRMNVVTGSSQTCGKLQLMRAKELEWDLMELTAHAGARPSHAKWQGQIVSLSGEAGYLSLIDIGYGETTGFKGINCRHDWMPFDKNSPRTYTQEMLDEYNNAKVMYNGKEISLYEATQMQRRMERQVRNNKKEIAGLNGILTSNTKDEKLLNEARAKLSDVKLKQKIHSSTLNDFLKQTKLRKDYSKLKVGKVSTSIVKSDIMSTKEVKKDVQFIGKLDRSKIGEYGKRIVTEDVVLTDERKTHILQDHGNDFKLIIDNIDRVILKPSEVLEDLKNKDTVYFIDKLEKNSLNVVVRLNTTNSKEHPQNSIMTAWIIRDKNLKKLRDKNKILYKKE